MNVALSEVATWGLTHFRFIADCPADVHLFEMSECESCGGALAAANRVIAHGIQLNDLFALRLKHHDGEIADGYYCEETDLEVCDNCADLPPTERGK